MNVLLRIFKKLFSKDGLEMAESIAALRQMDYALFDPDGRQIADSELCHGQQTTDVIIRVPDVAKRQ